MAALSDGNELTAKDTRDAMSTPSKEVSGSTFAIILFLYIFVVPAAIGSRILDDFPEWLLAIIAIPLGVGGFLMQIIPIVYIHDTLKSWGVYESKADSVATGIWLGFLFIYVTILHLYFS